MELPAVMALASSLEKGGVLPITGVCEPAGALVVALMHALAPEQPVLTIVDSLAEAESLARALETWHRFLHLKPAACDGPTAIVFPPWDVSPSEDKLPHPDVIGERLAVLIRLLDTEAEPRAASARLTTPPVVVSTITSVCQLTWAPARLREQLIELKPGSEADPIELVQWAEHHGFDPVARVTRKGEIARRGGILDVWPLHLPWPIRMEFAGNQLDSLREFDPITQLSRRELPAIKIAPAGELGFLKSALTGQDNATPTPGLAGSLMDYFPGCAVVVLFEPNRLLEHALDRITRTGAHPLYHTPVTVLKSLIDRGINIILVADQPDLEALANIPGLELKTKVRAGLRLEFEPMDAFRPIPNTQPPPEVESHQRKEFFAQMHRWLRQQFNLHVFCETEAELTRFRELWAETHPDPEPAGEPTVTQQPELHIGSLDRGFLWPEAKLVVVTGTEIFGRRRFHTPSTSRTRQAALAQTLIDLDLSELEEGDLVVHANHGIGKFVGIQRIPTSPLSGRHKTSYQDSDTTEYIVIEYAPRRAGEPPPRLYVPLSQAHLVSRYIGSTSRTRIRLNTLGGSRWAKTRARVEQSVRDLAAELLSIQAARALMPGHAFSPDTSWQRELESAFPFEETPDQLRAIIETKADMEKPVPMDRLICGDAGFGKTEVAIRAAFKAVMDGKQVAVLAPTTVLAQQHYNTFRERMAAFPVKIELLSRFKTRREQLNIIERLALGAVDIVIGTHRLLQDDVIFKDLGLLIIDEEQRFGVEHKEKLKKLRLTVDVLTMSATPIPRTLYLALCGARDISVIQTPPHDRLPIETIVAEYNDELVRRAILYELNREGQVFYLYNRVETIMGKAQALRQLVPEARLVVAHGKMRSDELERNMTRFVNGEFDVLLCTTIIENGIDIPRANTIIVDGADRFGLSQLYQLRGRVGRYKHQAYAYLLVPRHAMLLREVRRRLATIRQYATPGSGFKIAMRDLELRGAGNLLGPEQSGHIAAVGFDLYCKLLKQSIEALKGIPTQPEPEVELRLDFLAMSQPGTNHYTKTTQGTAVLPTDYIPDTAQRLEIYRKLAAIRDTTALEQLKSELRDRFGPIPEPVELLLLTTELKLLAAQHSISSVKVQSDKLILTQNGQLLMQYGRFPRLKSKTPGAKLREICRLIPKLAAPTHIHSPTTSHALKPNPGSGSTAHALIPEDSIPEGSNHARHLQHSNSKWQTHTEKQQRR